MDKADEADIHGSSEPNPIYLSNLCVLPSEEGDDSDWMMMERPQVSR